MIPYLRKTSDNNGVNEGHQGTAGTGMYRAQLDLLS